MEKTSPAVELPDRLQRMEAIFRTSRKRYPVDATDVLLQRQSVVKMNPEIFHRWPETDFISPNFRQLTTNQAKALW